MHRPILRVTSRRTGRTGPVKRRHYVNTTPIRKSRLTRPMTAVIAELEIPSDRIAMSDTLTQFEEITFDVQEIVAHDNVVSPFIWVSGVGVDRLESAFDADPSVGCYRQLTEKSDGSVLYEMEWSRDADVVLRLIEEPAPFYTRPGRRIAGSCGCCYRRTRRSRGATSGADGRG